VEHGAGDARVTVNDHDVTNTFTASNGGAILEGVVTGVHEGTNEVVATAGLARATVTLVNYPISGPIISGPHEQPFVCDTERFRMPAGGRRPPGPRARRTHPERGQR